MMLIAGVLSPLDFLFVLLFWGLPFALLAAIPLLTLATELSRKSGGFALYGVAGIVGAIAGHYQGYRLYWQAHGPTPAIVYFLGRAVAGGLMAIALTWAALTILSPTRRKSTSQNQEPSSISDTSKSS